MTLLDNVPGILGTGHSQGKQDQQKEHGNPPEYTQSGTLTAGFPMVRVSFSFQEGKPETQYQGGKDQQGPCQATEDGYHNQHTEETDRGEG